jgi:quinohemoprotein ethanol dehydrogenase
VSLAAKEETSDLRSITRFSRLNRLCRTARRSFPAVAVAWAWFAVVFLNGQQANSGRANITEAPAFDGSVLAKYPTANWPTNGGDLFNRRYSPLTQISRENVANLKGVWRTRLNGSGMGAKFSGEAQPVVYEGVIYLVTGANDVFAISLQSGDILWTYKANLDPAINTVCCGWLSRGVGLGERAVYVGQLDGKLVALDQRTGAVRWAVQAERWQEGYTITSAPLYYGGLVVTGFAGAERATRGRVKAFRAEDGSLVWTFFTVPGPGEFGHDTWPDNGVWRHGGGAVWQTPAIDPDLGLVYFSTANPGPDFNGAVRAGDNLFTCSIVALDVKTGKYRWHFQQVHHDIWDYDAPSPVVLFDIEIRGQTRKAAAQPGKTGWVYILDRVTGKPLIGIDERPVPQEPRQKTAATQPYPRGDAFVPQSVEIPPPGFRLINGGRIFTPFWTEGTVVKPGTYGGVNWPPSSFDPATGYLYVCAQDIAEIFRGGGSDYELPQPGQNYLGGRFNAAPMPFLGVFAALDMRTNTLVWQQHWPEFCYSGSAATAGGLVFVGRNDGRFTALDSRDGTLLWQFQTGAGANAPPSVFEYRGTQYVAIYSAGNLFSRSARGDSLWLFSLQGQMEPVSPPRPIVMTSSMANQDADLANGRRVYESSCSACHGANGEGGHGGGPPLRGALTRQNVAWMVNQGGVQMPAVGAELTAEHVRDVTAYVVQTLAVLR